jgi:Copper transport outer membrane protein, MctB
MINFRFHLASLIAIFLALALGVVVGAGVIDRSVVDTLNNRLDKVEQRSDRIEGENGQLRNANRDLANFIAAEQCYAVDGRLLAEDVAIVAVHGVDPDTVKRTASAVKCAGGNADGVLWLESKWALANDDDIKAMADVLGSSARRATTLRATAWKQLATRLKGVPVFNDASTDILMRLSGAGFVSFDGLGENNASLGAFPARGAAVMLVVGANAAVPDGDMVVPAATAITGEDVPLVVADVYVQSDGGPGRGDALNAIHDTQALAAKVSTVDNLDQPQGPATAVLAAFGTLQSPPIVGQYGLASGKKPLPEITAK